MKLNGYEIGREPTAEELETFRRVKTHLVAKAVAECLEDVPEPLTQREFSFVVMLEDNGDVKVNWPSVAVAYLNELRYRPYMIHK